MDEKVNITSREELFRAVIVDFIDDRRAAKLTGQEDDAEKAAKYEYATWLADAAQRVDQIQMVTHVLKATHPDARGSSLHVAPSSLPQHEEIGSHVLGTDYAEDVVGNAAALDVYKLLKVEVDGRRLLDWMQAGDADLQAALSDDARQATAWMQAFAALVRKDRRPASHTLAKQLYWLVGDTPQDDSHYHLLQPMLSSSLAHAVHTDIQDARFGDASKEARQARRDGKPSAMAYRDYRGLVARKLGGTKPQNISQLNSERGGVNYLLASLPPPAWKRSDGANLLQHATVFSENRSALYWSGNMRGLLRALVAFLKANPERTMSTRVQREAIERDIAQELALFGAKVRVHHEPGWTRDAACRLPLCEQLWLDPDRSELAVRDDPEHPEWQADDLTFNRAYNHGDWADQVAADFGLWLNGQLARLSGERLVLGDVEMRHFASTAVLDVAWPIPLQRRAGGGIA